MNSIVYPVDGGMEDWLYAAGWDTKGVRTDCLGGGQQQQQQETITISQQQEQHRQLHSLDYATAINHWTHKKNKLATDTTWSNDGGLRSKYLEDPSLPTLDHPRQETSPPTSNQSSLMSGNRAMVFLVETSDQKSPSTNTLGDTVNVSKSFFPSLIHYYLLIIYFSICRYWIIIHNVVPDIFLVMFDYH
jgi:hypothetical protein